MRKAWKHLFALAAAFVVAVATLGVRALAEDPTYKITIQNAEAGHTYEAYQIFAGTYSGGVLSDITWGTGIADTATLEAKYGTASALAEKLTATDNTKVDAKVLAAYLSTTTDMLSKDNVKSFTWNDADKTYTASGLPAGYYLVKDQDNSLDTSTGTSYTDFIMQVVGDVTIEAKGSAPTVTKTVLSGTTYQKYLDTAIGSTVTFKLEATLPTKYDNFSTYALSFVDTHDPGLTYSANTASITAQLVHAGADTGTTIANTAYTTTYSDTERKLTIAFSNLKADVADAKFGDHIIVTYNMTLNENAVIGGNGNPNTVKLDYSNNPTKKDSTGSTPEDKAIVFTYGVRIAKVDQDRKALTGATFTLESKGTDGTYKTVGDATVSDNLHTWKGLAPGTYRLTETAAPAQYNKLAKSMEFTITASHTPGTNGSVDHVVGASDVSIDGTTTHFVSVTDDTSTYLGLTVQNKKGSTLPSTGGMGTTLFYGIGGLLVVAGGALFIAKKNAGKIN